MLIKIVKKQLLTLYDWMAEDYHCSKYSFAICSSLSTIAPLVCPLKLCVTFVFFPGCYSAPKRNDRQCLCKILGGQTRCIMVNTIFVSPCLPAVYCKARNHAWTFFNSKTSCLFSFFCQYFNQL